ncbi:MAG TPA: hypothetical protein V6C88_17630 [Chroococcidiopsis sp.]
MNYAFEIIGISPILSFFNFQADMQHQRTARGAEYFGTHHCTLDALLEGVQPLPPQRGWNLDQVVDTVINFWINNGEQVGQWRQRLADAGDATVLVARVADLSALKDEFEHLFSAEC